MTVALIGRLSFLASVDHSLTTEDVNEALFSSSHISVFVIIPCIQLYIQSSVAPQHDSLPTLNNEENIYSRFQNYQKIVNKYFLGITGNVFPIHNRCERVESL